MAVTDQMEVVYPVGAEVDEELRKLTAEHPGLASRLAGKGTKRAAAAATRSARRSLARGWARVRGCAGSLAAFGTATFAVFEGWGLVPGLFAAAVSLVVGEKLLEPPKQAST
jgi:hypothetical protein